MKYKATKLVNNAGKMWHIGLEEGDVAKHVILPGDPARCEIIAKHFQDAELKAISRGNPTYTGKYNDTDVSVMATGMGGTAVAICVEELKQLGAKTLLLGNLIKNELMQARNWPMGATLSIAMLLFTFAFIGIYKWVTGEKTLGGIK